MKKTTLIAAAAVISLPRKERKVKQALADLW